MITIRRTETDKYELVDTDGEVAETYHQTRMDHPDDWIQDARDAGLAVSGPYDWQFRDVRD